MKLYLRSLLLRKDFTKMNTPTRTPSPLTLPPAVCPGAPVKEKKSRDPIGFSAVKNLNHNLFSSGDDGYETPDDQQTVPWNAPPVRKK